MNRVSVVGLGKLGACIAACFAHKGFQVVGVDVNPESVHQINEGQSPVFEPGLAALMKGVRTRLRATSDCRQAVFESDATFIVVPTPTDEHGGFSLHYAVQAAREIGAALRQKPGYHLVVLTSTVLPGSTEFGILPVLEAASGKRCGGDFGLCYSPEFIALGTVIRDFLKPDFLLIGESDQRAGNLLAGIYHAVCDRKAPVARMNFVNAELAKIAVNTYVTMRISFANTLAALCEQLPGGDVDVVTGAMGLDSRISPRYLKGGLGYGGPCFPRDNQALAYLARKLGHPATLAEATDAYNRTIPGRLAARVMERIPEGGTVAVLGMSYKPDSTVVDEAQGLLLASLLADNGVRVVVHDPVALDNARQVLKDRVSYVVSVDEALAGADVVVIANPDRAYQSLPLKRGQVVIDTWRLLRSEAPEDGYVPLGLGEQPGSLGKQLADLRDGTAFRKS